MIQLDAFEPKRLQQAREIGAALDQGQICFAQAAVEQCLGKNAGAGAELDDRCGRHGDFARDRLGKRKARRSDGADRARVRP